MRDSGFTVPKADRSIAYGHYHDRIDQYSIDLKINYSVLILLQVYTRVKRISLTTLRFVKRQSMVLHVICDTDWLRKRFCDEKISNKFKAMCKFQFVLFITL